MGSSQSMSSGRSSTRLSASKTGGTASGSGRGGSGRPPSVVSSIPAERGRSSRTTRLRVPSVRSTRSRSGRRNHARTASSRAGEGPFHRVTNCSVDHLHGDDRASRRHCSAVGSTSRPYRPRASCGQWVPPGSRGARLPGLDPLLTMMRTASSTRPSLTWRASWRKRHGNLRASTRTSASTERSSSTITWLCWPSPVG